ncbi:dihydrolipoyl dehydrogenase [Hydrogenophaga sp.]|uniref:dihydrolipoyl dehydrogenase n=1 Tax=Hydrogenophaga sp. TaxID=1904254 RepID=UPI00271D2956|nr:dihydrolipoyl dehydrogenase [Hydrogenophaga sp.]MDO9434121.1 dihydrolipoyl dehydrogenase [Hydrogenophaga sp.]
MATIDIQVPDIGDFDEVSVIELLVKAGDTVKAEQSLITVESDKASMEIPSSQGGVVKEVKVKLGDKVKQGSVVLTLEAADVSSPSPVPAGERRGEGSSPAQASAPVAPSPQPSPAIGSGSGSEVPAPVAAAGPIAATFGGNADLECDVLVLGGGPGGYSAAFRAADLGLKVVIVERYATLGGVCLNVGCIPSKALLHVAAVMDEVSHMADLGVEFGRPVVNIEKLRGHKEKVIGKLTGGLSAMAKMRKVTTVRGVGSFVGANHLEVEETSGVTGQEKTGKKQVIAFKKAIIAAGSQAVRLPFMPDDPRVVDSTGALALKDVPKRMLILGGGIIGLEMGTVYSTLGARLDVVEMLDGLMQGADRDLVKIWQKMNAKRFDNIMLKTKTVGAKATPEGIEVSFASAEEGGKAPEPQTYDLVLQAVGRTPNGKKIGAEKAGVSVTDRGFINVDIQMRTNVPHIFAIGDIVGQPMLAHKAVHEAHVAAEVIAGELQGNKELASAAFNARVIPSVAYTDPEVAWVGLTEDQAKAQGIKVKKGLFPWTASGRAIANGRDEGVTKLLFDDSPEAHGHGKILGGGMVGTHAGDMIGEIALAIEMGADAVDIGKTIHPHPTLGESIGLAAEVAHGSCTDVPPARKPAG